MAVMSRLSSFARKLATFFVPPVGLKVISYISISSLFFYSVLFCIPGGNIIHVCGQFDIFRFSLLKTALQTKFQGCLMEMG